VKTQPTQTIDCDTCGATVPADKIYTDAYDNTVCKTCYDGVTAPSTNPYDVALRCGAQARRHAMKFTARGMEG
jgi:hypothetical protein